MTIWLLWALKVLGSALLVVLPVIALMELMSWMGRRDMEARDRQTEIDLENRLAWAHQNRERDEEVRERQRHAELEGKVSACGGLDHMNPRDIGMLRYLRESYPAATLAFHYRRLSALIVALGEQRESTP